MRRLVAGLAAGVLISAGVVASTGVAHASSYPSVEIVGMPARYNWVDKEAAGVTSLTVTQPSTLNVNVNCVEFAAVQIHYASTGSTGLSTAITPPSGWAKVQTGINSVEATDTFGQHPSSWTYSQTYTHTCATADQGANVTWNFGGTVDAQIRDVAWDNVNTATPVETLDYAGSATTNAVDLIDTSDKAITHSSEEMVVNTFAYSESGFTDNLEGVLSELSCSTDSDCGNTGDPIFNFSYEQLSTSATRLMQGWNYADGVANTSQDMGYSVIGDSYDGDAAVHSGIVSYITYGIRSPNN